MKKVLFLVATAMLLAGCNGLQKKNQLACNVNPDEVFGRHYTVEDFQFWDVLDVRGTEYAQFMNLVSQYDITITEGHPIMCTVRDTAALFASATALCEELAKEGTRYYPRWMSENDTVCTLYFLFGKSTPDGVLPIMDGSMIDTASAEKSEFGMEYQVNFTFKDRYVRLWAEVTCERIGKCIAMTLGDKVLMAPMVNAEITGGRCTVTGNFTLEEACALAQILNTKE